MVRRSKCLAYASMTSIGLYKSSLRCLHLRHFTNCQYYITVIHYITSGNQGKSKSRDMACTETSTKSIKMASKLSYLFFSCKIKIAPFWSEMISNPIRFSLICNMPIAKNMEYMTNAKNYISDLLYSPCFLSNEREWYYLPRIKYKIMSVIS